MKRATLRTWVSARDIRNGIRGSQTQCPVHNSLSRLVRDTDLSFTVSFSAVFFKQWPKTARRLSSGRIREGANDVADLFMDATTLKWIEDYDGGYAVQPFTAVFTIGG